MIWPEKLLVCTAMQVACVALRTTCNALRVTCIALQATYDAMQVTRRAMRATCIAMSVTCIATPMTSSALQVASSAVRTRCWWRFRLHPGAVTATIGGGFRQNPGFMALFRQNDPNSTRMEDTPNHDTWKEWFQLHGPKLLLCARQWTRSLADAEDVVQEAFVRFWRHQRALPGDPVALLVTSVRRAAFDRARRDLRRTAREERVAEGEENHPALFATSLENDDRRAAIESALQRLPAEQREVLVLKIWSELTFEEIATQLDIPPNTAASRYRYALAALRKELIAADCHG
jgi:RNA polymerase sigma-70 factor (ECF subfamily)